jgi:hypothetical protein
MLMWKRLVMVLLAFSSRLFRRLGRSLIDVSVTSL